MPEIRPFRGLRFTPSAGDLQTLIAPPYDVLSKEERDRLAEGNHHNIVHLTLPEGRADDRSKYVKYARSSALLSEWRRDGVFLPDERPSFYRYTQWFQPLPGQAEVERTSLIALIKVEPFSSGWVLPHEHTFPKHKEDRLRLLEATRSHLESIYGLYEDPSGAVLSLVKSSPADSMIEATMDGVRHRLEPISDLERTMQLQAALLEKRVWIADGHHRYETALAFREALGHRDGPVAEDYMVMALSSMNDPGLVLLPTHRVVETLKGSSLRDLQGLLGDYFEFVPTSPQALFNAVEQACETSKHVFGIICENEQSALLVPKNVSQLLELAPYETTQRLRELDASLLHKVLFEKLIGLSATTAILYTRDPSEAITLVNQGAGVAFLMAPPSVDDMKEIALSGERMPQKSTYYFPKIYSGFVAWSLSDFER